MELNEKKKRFNLLKMQFFPFLCTQEGATEEGGGGLAENERMRSAALGSAFLNSASLRQITSHTHQARLPHHITHITSHTSHTSYTSHASHIGYSTFLHLIAPRKCRHLQTHLVAPSTQCSMHPWRSSRRTSRSWRLMSSRPWFSQNGPNNLPLSIRHCTSIQLLFVFISKETMSRLFARIVS